MPRDGGCAGSVFVGGVTCGVPNLPSLFSGTMLLQLSGPSESQELLVTSGIISVPLGPNGAVSLTTGVTGTVDCMSRKLTGEIPRTMLTAEQTGLLFPIITILLCAAGDAVEGSVQGTLDPNGLGILGEVSMTIGTCMCTGTFDLRSQQ